MPKRIIPAFEWLFHYQKSDLRGDLVAGLIVAIMLVPQSMAYAMLAGLPPVMGLYVSTQSNGGRSESAGQNRQDVERGTFVQSMHMGLL